jgi:hypothetical protein
VGRRTGVAAAALALLGSVTAPRIVAAHALGQTFQLPIPGWIYLASAGVAVAASFVVATAVARPPGSVAVYPVRPVGLSTARAGGLVLRVIGIAWWLWALWGAFALGGETALPAVLFWILLWVGVPITAILLGNPWPSLSPFRTLYDLLEAGARWLGVERLDAQLPYPAALARWPAVALLFAGIWAELILPGRSEPSRVGAILLLYTLLTLAGMLLFGRIAWLRNAELFEVLLGWLGRIGPVGRRSVDPALCAGCEEGCDPARCVDCPECAAAADAGERRIELRPWFAGLTEPARAGWSDAAFIVLALAGVTYDGLLETSLWGNLLDLLYDPIAAQLGAATASIVVGTIGLLGVWLLFLAAFSIATALTRRLGAARSATRKPFGAILGRYAVTLLPIAGGYLIAHYLTEVIQGFEWIPVLMRDPMASVAPSVDWIPIQLVWYLSVGAIVLGHVVAVVLAHRLALRHTPARPILAGLPLVLLMIGYTVLSLWIIAQPITIEPRGTLG